MDKSILKAINELDLFLNSSIINIVTNNDCYWAFPHFKGKYRATECGGTSSAISALKMVSKYTNNRENESKIRNAYEWLLSKQQPNGAWQAAGIYSSEVTARILCDLHSLQLQNSDNLQKACDFIVSCFDTNGYFLSTPQSAGTPHLYTTYICTLALSKYNRLGSVDTEKITTWVLNSMSHDNRWGIYPCYDFGTVTYTIFALNLLCLCGMDYLAVKKKYKKQITWIKKQIHKNMDAYALEEIREEKGADEYGIKYSTSITQHNCIALLGNFFINLNEKYFATHIMKNILHSQYAGGWGPSRDRLTMWACQQNIEFLLNYQHYSNQFSNLTKVFLHIWGKKFRFVLLGLSIIGIALSILWIIMDVQRFQDAMLTIILSVLIAIFSQLFTVND